MKTTHVYRPANEDPGLATLVIEDSNSTPYVPASPETLTSGALTWDGRDVYLSQCAGCVATGDESPCAQRVVLRDLDELVLHEADVAPLKAQD